MQGGIRRSSGTGREVCEKKVPRWREGVMSPDPFAIFAD